MRIWMLRLLPMLGLVLPSAAQAGLGIPLGISKESHERAEPLKAMPGAGASAGRTQLRVAQLPLNAEGAAPDAPVDDAFVAALRSIVRDVASDPRTDVVGMAEEVQAEVVICMATALADIPAEQQALVIGYTDALAAMGALQRALEPAINAEIEECVEAVYRR